MADELFGRLEAKRGERCTNNGYGAKFTTPCCYADVDDEGATRCPECAAPIICSIEQEPVSVCRIADEESETA